MEAKQILPLVKRTLSDWTDDKATTLAAALAYYTVFSIAPLLIIAVAVAGLVFGQEAARGEIQEQLQGLVGASGAKVIQDMMLSASKPSEGLLATLVGLLILLFGASGVFAQLQDSMNVIWKAKPPKINGILDYIRVRFLSFAMVLGVGFLLLVSLVLNAGLAAVGAYASRILPGYELIWQVVNLTVSFGVITLLFAMMYKVLPDTPVAWRDVWLGAAVTSVLFSLGKLAIGLYLGKSGVASTYGAAGSVAILLIWVYYSAQILFLGAEFAHAFSESHGSRSGVGKAASPTATPEKVAPSTWVPQRG